MAPNAAAVSFNPASFVEGGLIDDVDVTFKEAVFCLYDYNGKQPDPVLALGIKMVDPEGKEFDQYYSAGDKKYFVPSDDGKTLVPVGDKVGLNNNTNAAKLFASLLAAGFPEAKLNTGNLTALEGLVAHVQRVAQPTRAGLIKNANQSQKKGPDTVLLVSRIVSLPGEGAAAPAKTQLGKAAPAAPKGPVAVPAAAPAPTNGAAAASASDIDEMLDGLVMGVVAANGGSIEKKSISQAIFKAAQADADAKPKAAQLVARAFKDEYLQTLNAKGMSFNGTVISMGA